MGLQKLQNEYDRIQPQIIELSNYLIKVANGLIKHDKEISIDMLREQYKSMDNYARSLHKMIKQIQRQNLMGIWQPQLGEEYWVIDLSNVDNVKKVMHLDNLASDLTIQRFGAFPTKEKAYEASEMIIDELFNIQQSILEREKVSSENRGC